MILNKISTWYFHRSALPYWGELLLDCAIVAVAGYFAAYLKLGGIGFRDGEKLFEEVLAEKEKTKPTVNRKIFVAQVREYEF